jgi:hypothetical protein
VCVCALMELTWCFELSADIPWSLGVVMGLGTVGLTLKRESTLPILSL